MTTITARMHRTTMPNASISPRLGLLIIVLVGSAELMKLVIGMGIALLLLVKW